jgi:predicted nucleotidyltransferase
MATRPRNLDDITMTLRSLLPELRERWGVHRIGVFGSWARGEQSPTSDLDLLVEFSESRKLSLLDIVELELTLCETLGLKVDLVERSALKPEIGRRILQQVQQV